MSVHSEPSEVLMATENPCLWGQCRGWLAVQDCPRATPPAEPGLIPAQLHCCLSSQQVLDTGNDCPGSDRSTVPAAASADPEGWAQGDLVALPPQLQGHFQPSLHCRHFPSPGCSPHLHTQHSQQMRAGMDSILRCVWNSDLFSSAFIEIVTEEKKLPPDDAADQHGLNFSYNFLLFTCWLEPASGVGRIFLFYVLSSSLKVEFLNVIMNK